MTIELQKKILAKLLSRDSELFFNKLDSATEMNADENTFMIELKREWDTNKQAYNFDYYELKDEFKEKLQNLSLSEILLIVQANNSDLKTIRKWVVFMGWVVLISVIISAVYWLIVAIQIQQL